MSTGEHELTRRWAGDALGLPDGEDVFSTGQAAVLVAAPLILADPQTARHLLLTARRAAEQGGSTLLRGGVQMWLNMAHLCSPDLDLPLADDRDVGAFGGPRSVGWQVGRQVGAVSLAEHGRLEEALALLEPLGSTSVDDDERYRVAVEALAGDPDIAVRMARSVIGEIDRRSDVVWHAELLVMLGIAHNRAHRYEDAVVHMEVAKRAPMVFPFFYALARRHGRAARSALDPSAATRSVERARQLTVETLLDREVRGHAVTADRRADNLP